MLPQMQYAAVFFLVESAFFRVDDVVWLVIQIAGEYDMRHVGRDRVVKTDQFPGRGKYVEGVFVPLYCDEIGHKAFAGSIAVVGDQIFVVYLVIAENHSNGFVVYREIG